MNNKRIGKHILRLIFCLVCISIIPCMASSVYGKVYIDINSPAFQKFPIAITDFKITGEERRQPDLSAWFSDNLSKYLSITGFFNVISKKAFLEDQKQTGSATEVIRFADWSAIGAEYLVKGSYLYSDKNLIMEFRLFDVVKGEVITAKRYTGTGEDKIEMVRKFAGEILFALTGDRGVFDTKIAFVLKKGNNSNIYTINFDGTDLAKVTNYQSLTLSPRWSPDGKYMSFTSYKDGNPDLYIKAVNSGKVEKLAGFEGINLSGSWSNDGRRLLLTLSKDGNENLYSMDLSNKEIKRLTKNFSIDVSPTWSPDNRKIAFVSNRAGTPQLYTMDSDGNNIKRLTYDGSYNTSPSWSPRGDRIAYEGLVNNRFQIFSINEDGSEPLQLTLDNVNHESPSWSPDGRYLVYSSTVNGKCKVCIINANGSNMRILYENTGGCITPSWSPLKK